jgi:hypothetical protein
VNLALLDSSHELNKIEDVQAYYEVGDVVEPGDDLMDWSKGSGEGNVVVVNSQA